MIGTAVKNDVVMSTREAADYLGLAEDTVRQYINRGLIEAEKELEKLEAEKRKQLGSQRRGRRGRR